MHLPMGVKWQIMSYCSNFENVPVLSSFELCNSNSNFTCNKSNFFFFAENNYTETWPEPQRTLKHMNSKAARLNYLRHLMHPRRFSVSEISKLALSSLSKCEEAPEAPKLRVHAPDKNIADHRSNPGDPRQSMIRTHP